MELLSKIRSKFTKGTKNVQRSALKFNILRPTMGLRELYAIERQARSFHLVGWLRLNLSGSLEASLEGAQLNLQRFLYQLDTEQIVPQKLQLHHRWCSPINRFSILSIRQASILLASEFKGPDQVSQI